MSGVPAGWSECELENVVEVLDSWRIPLNSNERLLRISGKKPEELVPYYGATGQVGLVDDFIFDEPLILLGEDGVPFFDLLKAKAYSVSGKTWVNNHAHVLRPIAAVSHGKYVEHFLNSFDYKGYVAGTTRLKLTQGSMNKIPVRLAPFAEQKRIADKLDGVLARVDACRDRLDRIPTLLKRFRQSVLAAATSGRLTEDWRVQRGGAVMADYAKVKLSTVTESRLGKMLDKAKNSGTATPYLRNINVRWFAFDLSDTQEMLIENVEREALLVKDGDLLVCEGGEPGRCAIWNGIADHFIFQKALHRVRADLNQLLPSWLAYSIKYAAENGSLEGLFTGTTIKHLTGIALSNFEFPLPSLEEQTEIVRRVDLLFAFADRLEARLVSARQQVGQLTPALLAKAFRGELVAQDPADEPASVLLQRLASQRAAAPKGRRGRSAGAA